MSAVAVVPCGDRIYGSAVRPSEGAYLKRCRAGP